MHIHLICVGKTNFPEADKGVERYLGRIRRYTRLTFHVVKPEKIRKNRPESVIKQIETERISRLVAGSGKLLVWDQHGKQLDSLNFARFIQKLENAGTQVLWMVVGGPLGLSPSLLHQADYVLSLSAMTFPHDIARLLVAEQLYRAYSIIRGNPYHK